jgi:dTDP-4-dehydrorhamnose reductase
MLGWRLAGRLTAWGEVWGATRGRTEVPGLDPRRTLRAGAEDAASLVDALDQAQPDVVVNAIGVVKQLDAASDPRVAIRINALFPHELAQLARRRGARLIHFSTDCVFNGKGGPYRESDPPDATDLYGRTKLLGEVVGTGCLTLRTSIVGHELASAHGLLGWFLGQRGRAVKGYARALFSGVTTDAMAALVGRIAVEFPALEGTWQVAGPAIAKYDLLQLFEQRYRTGSAIARDDTVTIDRRLDGSRFGAATGWAAPSWPAMIDEMAREAARAGLWNEAKVA